MTEKHKKEAKKGKKKGKSSIMKGKGINLGPNGMPMKAIMVFQYNYTHHMSGATPTPQVFYINSIYQPSVTGGGANHKPINYTELAHLYKEYCVISAEVDIEFINTGDSTALVLVSWGDENNASITIKKQMEDRLVTKKTLTNIQRRWRFKRNLSIPKVTGIDPKIYGSDDYTQASIGSNPQDTAYLWFTGVCIDGINSATPTTNINVYCNIQIRYKTMLRARVDPASLASTKNIFKLVEDKIDELMEKEENDSDKELEDLEKEVKEKLKMLNERRATKTTKSQ